MRKLESLILVALLTLGVMAVPSAGQLRTPITGGKGATLYPGPGYPVGVPGKAGSVWRDGTGAPSTILGVDGDYYLDDATGAVYRRQSGLYTVVATLKGSTGSPGSQGPSGATWRSGNGSPANSLGVDGDFYLNLLTGDVYLRSSGVYTVTVNLQGPPGPTGPAGPAGSGNGAGLGWVNAADKGADPTGVADATAAIQAAVDATPASGGTVYLPPGTLAISDPIYLDKNNLTVKGSARYGTTVTAAPFGGRGSFVVGLRRRTLDGRTVTLANRPDCVNILDAAAAPAANTRRGLATLGDLNGVMVARERTEQFAGLTVQAYIDATNAGGQGQPVVGYTPMALDSPWHFSTYLSNRTYKLWMRFSDNGPTREVHATVPNTVPFPFRLRVWANFTDGTYGASVTTVTAGVATTTPLTVDNGGAPSFAGLSLLPNRAGYPMMIAQADSNAHNTGGCSNITLYGLRVSSAAITTEPADDLARYFNTSGTDYMVLPLNDVTPARHLRVDMGGARNAMFLVHSAGAFEGPVDNTEISDVGVNSVENGILLGTFQRARIRNVGALCQSHGVASLPIYFSYLLDIDSCEVAGVNSPGISLAQIDRASLNSVDVKNGGPYQQALLAGCSLAWRSGMFLFPSGSEVVVDLRDRNYGGMYRLQNLEFDSEGAGFLTAAIRCFTHSYTQTDLDISQIMVGSVGNGIPVIQLHGLAVDSNHPPARIHADGLLSGDATAKSAVNVTGPGWYGDVDARTLPAAVRTGTSDIPNNLKITVNSSTPW